MSILAKVQVSRSAQKELSVLIRAPPALQVLCTGVLNLLRTSQRSLGPLASKKSNCNLLGEDSIESDLRKSTKPTHSRTYVNPIEITLRNLISLDFHSFTYSFPLPLISTHSLFGFT